MADRRATLLDVARAAGVSRTTVSNAFNRPNQLSAELRLRIMARARELGYGGPDPVARMLRTGRAGAIGVVFADGLPYAFSDPASIAFLQGVAEVCARERSGLLILPGADDATTEELIKTAVVDGFVLYCMIEDAPFLDVLVERGLPTVAVDLERRDWMTAVNIDDEGGAHAAARHLLTLGHHRLAVLSFELSPQRERGYVPHAALSEAIYAVTASRWRGYLRAVTEAGQDPLAVPIYACPGDDDATAVSGAIELLSRDPRPTAILAMSDRLAHGVVLAAARLGLAIPAELSIVGFDDIPLAAELVPPLTTVRQPLIDKGRLAAEGLFAPRQAGRVMLPTELIVRGSTAPPP